MTVSDAIFISLPAEKDREKTYREFCDCVNKSASALNIAIFDIPVKIKSETLDKLVTLQERYKALEVATESIIHKMVQYMADMLEEHRDKLDENLVVNGVVTREYIRTFSWDAAKFPTTESLQLLLERADAIVGRIENEFRGRIGSYNSLRNSLQALEKKKNGSLLTRNLNEVVKEDQFVLNSEYLTTALVVVPRHAYQEWQNTYESLVDMVVPRSSELVFEDQDYGLWTVTLFKKMLSDFTNNAKENKFIVRDFTFNAQDVEVASEEKNKLNLEKKKLFPAVFRFLKINYGELYLTLAHIKSLQLFVESIMRYGLPVDFMTAILVVPRKNLKKLRDALMEKYQHLDTLAAKKFSDDDMFLAGVVRDDEYYPYVSVTLGIDVDIR